MSFSFWQKAFQPLAREPRDAARPVRVELVAAVVREEIGAVDAVALAEPQQLAVEGDEPLVDVVELLDQRIDARLVERQRLHVGDDLVGELLVAALLRGRQRARLRAAADQRVLQAAELLVVRGDAVEGLEHRRLDLRLHRGERQIVLVIVVLVGIEVGAGAVSSSSSPTAFGSGGLGSSTAGAATGAGAHARRASTRRSPASWRPGRHRSLRGR